MPRNSDVSLCISDEKNGIEEREKSEVTSREIGALSGCRDLGLDGPSPVALAVAGRLAAGMALPEQERQAGRGDGRRATGERLLW